MRNILSILTLLIVFIFVANSQETSNPCRKSTEGTDFWFGFMESRNYSSNHYIEITVTAHEATKFKVYTGTNETQYGPEYFVNRNSSIQIRIDPWSIVEATGSEVVQDKSIRLISENPVNVYALNYDRSSADVAVIYPVESLGKEYFAICYDPNIHERNDGSYGNGRNSEFLIVAPEDSTNVLIIPSKTTDKLVPAGDSILVVLNKGEAYQVQSMNFENLAGQGDLTGSYISSDKPIAFFSGSLATTIPAQSGVNAWDHLYEQIPPIHSWGREYFAVPLKSREQDRYRVMAAQDNTIIYIDGFAPIFLNRGEYEEFILYYNDPKRIYAEKPILVAQYSQSKSVDEAFTGGHGDPFMIILSSTTQSKNDVSFVAYDSDQIQKYFVNIVTLTSEIPNIRFNGSALNNSDFQSFPNSKYSFAQKAINPGPHRINNMNEELGFLAYVYGFGNVESYGYGVGFNLDLVLDLGESIGFQGDTLLLCHGDSRTLDAGPYFDTYNWNTGDTTQTLKVTEGGKYSVKTTTIDGCELEDSIYIFVSRPIVDLGIENDQGCFPYSILLDGNNGFKKYIWQNQLNDTISNEQLIAVDQTGEYRITVIDKYSCFARDTMNLVVFPVPKTIIKGETLICGETSSLLSVLITDAPDSIWNYNDSFTWSSNKPELQFSDSTHTSSKIEASEWGAYEIYYRLETIDGCITGDTFQVRFHPQPTSSFVFEDDSKCEGYSKKLIYDGAATDTAFFYWDLDGCQFVDTLEWQIYNVTVGAFLSSTPFIELVIDDNGCWSDTTIRPLGAKPNFTMEADNLRGCDELTVNFTSQLLTEDNVDFVWTFGDGEVVESQNVTKHYPSTGFYEVTLTITNPVTQCQNGFTLDSMVRIFMTPTASITADPSFCHNDSANIFYTNTVDSSFCTWGFIGAHQSGVGNDSITVVLDEPFGTAILTVDEYGCISQPLEMKLKRNPYFDFYTETQEGCQPYLFEISAEPIDDFLDFTWITDSLTYPTGISNNFLLVDSGRFDVTLIANSQETGCIDTLTKLDWLWVHPKPLAAFEVDFPIALIEHSEITYTNLSEYATNYFWDFGDNSNSNEKDPVHTFTELGEFDSQLFVESDFGCKDTSNFLITILPFTVYTPNAFRPDSEIPENRTFMPVGIGADISRFNIKIYDRWGQIVFESKTPENPWNGTTKNGTSAPVGNYVWISNYFDIQGFEHNQKGQVLLVR